MRKTKELNISMDFLYIQKSEGGEIMKNKKLLFIGVLTAFLMLAVPFAVVSFDVDNVDATDGPDSTESGSEIEPNYIVAIGETSYESVQGAINATETMDTSKEITIKFLKDASGDGFIIPENKNLKLTFDLNGKTYTFNGMPVASGVKKTIGAQLLKGNTIEFINGKLDVVSTNKDSTDDNKFVMMIQNYSELTLNNVTLDGSNLANAHISGIGDTNFVLSSNGNATVLGSSSIVAGDNGYALDACRYATYLGAQVTFGTGESGFTGTVTGKIAYGGIDTSANDNEVVQSTSITVNGGTFNIYGFQKYDTPKTEIPTINLNSGTFNIYNGGEVIFNNILGIAGNVAFTKDFKATSPIMIKASEGLNVSGIEGNSLAGLIVNGNSNNVTISGVRTEGAGILVKNVMDCTITNCVISNLGLVNNNWKTTVGHFAGIGLSGISGKILLENNVIDTNNGADNNVRYGVSINGVTADQGVDIKGNEIKNIGYSALFLQNIIGTVNVSGNTFTEWNCENSPDDAGRAIRTNDVDTLNVTDNRFFKDYGNRSYADIGNLLKADFDKTGDNTTGGTVTFTGNQFNDAPIKVSVTNQGVANGKGIFFDRGISIDHDSTSSITIEDGMYYWEDVSITGNVIIDQKKTAEITVYGTLVIGKDRYLDATDVTMTSNSKLDNKGSLIVISMSIPENSDVLLRAGSSISYNGIEHKSDTDERIKSITEGALNIVSTVDSETDKFVSEDGKAEIDIGSQSSVTVEDELTVELNVQNGNAGYTVLFPAGTVILKGAEVSIEEVSSESDMPMAMFEVHFKDIDTKGDIIQITLPTSGISNPYVFFVDDGEYVLMETVGEPGKMITFETTHNSTYAIISADDVLDYGYPSEESSNGIDVNIIYIVEIVLIALALIGLAAVIRRN